MTNRLIVQPKRQPAYNMARGLASLVSTPPYGFRDVTMRVFPLRASINRLRAFCDDYLNIVPPEIANFRPSMPYVIMAVAHYPEITPEMHSGGWTSQNEVVFTVMLDWFRLENGREVYVGPASVSPFIFVDDDSSQATGREVYGWPKVQGWHGKFDPNAKAPDVRQHPLVKMESFVFSRAFERELRERRVVLEIDYQQPNIPISFPPDLRSAFNPIVGASEFMISGIKSWVRMAETVLSPPARGYEALDWLRMPARLQAAMQQMQLLRPPWADTVALKQFRDAEAPNMLCYQALVRSRMEVDRFHRGGLLGGENLLCGDRSGGFQIRLHQFPSIPIAQELGIEVDTMQVGDHNVQVIVPEFPFWSEMDMLYSRGENLAWRSRHSEWHRHVETNGKRSIEVVDDRRPKRGNPFNTARGGAVLTMTPPFEFHNVLVRVMPLLANPDVLGSFVNSYLNLRTKSNQDGLEDQNKYKFEPFGRYVYLLVYNFTEVQTQAMSIGQWVQDEVRFSIPVKCWNKEDGKLHTIGLVSPFTYGDSEMGTAIAREVYGWPTIQSEIRSKRRGWLFDHETDLNAESLLEVDVPLVDAIGLGQKREPQTLIQIDTDDEHRRRQRWRPQTAGWRRILRKERDRKELIINLQGRAVKALVALGLGPLAQDKAIPELSVKQFRDAEEPLRACYQAIVEAHLHIAQLRRLWAFEEKDVRVCIRRTLGQPIVESLGLHRMYEQDQVDVLEPVNPFSMRVHLSLENGRELWKNVGNIDTKASKDGANYISRQLGYSTGCMNIQAELSGAQSAESTSLNYS